MHAAQKIAALQQQLGDAVQVYRREKAPRASICFFSGWWPWAKEQQEDYRIVAGWWLWIEDKGDFFRVFRASGKTHHSRESGQSFAADFNKQTGERQLGPAPFKGAWESFLTMHPIRDDKRAKEIFDRIASEVDAAYRHHFNVEAADKAA